MISGYCYKPRGYLVVCLFAIVTFIKLQGEVEHLAWINQTTLGQPGLIGIQAIQYLSLTDQAYLI